MNMEHLMSDNVNKAIMVVLLFLGCTVGCESTTVLRQPEPAVRFIAFGDSTTAGPSQRDYPDMVRELIDEPVEAFANEGKSGESTDKGLARFQELLSLGIFPNATTLLYWEGGNDLAAFIGDQDRFLLFSPDDPDFPYNEPLTAMLNQVQTNIEQTIRLGQGAGLRVLVSTYFPLAPTIFIVECGALPFNVGLSTQIDKANVYLERLNERIRAAARSTGVELVDISLLSNELQADRDNYVDCNHLSAAGNRIAAELFLETLGP